MRQGGRGAAAGAVIVLALLAGCGSGSDDGDGDDGAADTATDAGGDPSSTTTAPDEETATSETPSDEPSGAGTATLTATGAFSVEVIDGVGFCAFYFPGEQRGISYTISSLDNPGTGSWDFHVQGNDAADAGALLNTEGASFGNDAAGGNGTINATDDPPTHVDFDLDLVNVVQRDQVVHVTGSIDCP